jgi:SAM-dependent methyltransferase
VTLAPLASVRSLLACPRCRAALTDRGAFACTRPGCPFAGAEGFRMLAGRWLVLVDPTSSVIDVHQLSRLAPGPEATAAADSRSTAAVRRLVRPVNEVAARHVDRLCRLLPTDPLLLVVGGGTIGNGVDALYSDSRLRVLAFDIVPTAHVQLVADGHQIPLADASVDAVVVQAVLEHVLDPWQVVAEIHRVLRPQGLVYAETPFMQQVHAGRYDFTRFSDSGHRWLFRNFTELDRGVVAGPGTALTWSIDHLARAVFRSRTAGQIARLLFFWLRFADRVADPRYAADAASALYFLGRRSERPITPAEAVAGYAGAQARTGRGAGTPSSE